MVQGLGFRVQGLDPFRLEAQCQHQPQQQGSFGNDSLPNEGPNTNPSSSLVITLVRRRHEVCCWGWYNPYISEGQTNPSSKGHLVTIPYQTKVQTPTLEDAPQLPTSFGNVSLPNGSWPSILLLGLVQPRGRARTHHHFLGDCLMGLPQGNTS